MIDVKRFNTHLSNVSAGSMNGVTLDQVLIFRREGIAMQFEAVDFGTTSDTFDVYSFQYFAQAQEPTYPSTRYFIQTLMSTGVQRTYKFEIGTWMLAGWVYSLTTNIGPVYSYEVQPGDTFSDVLNALALQLDGAGFTTSISGQELTVTGLLVVTLTPSITWGPSLNRYVTGYFINYDGDEYILAQNESDSGYPALPAIAGSYDFNDLTATGYSNISYYLYDAIHFFPVYSEALAGSTTITNIPDVASPGADPNKIYIDDASNLFYLGTPTTDLVERFDCIYKVTL